MDQLSFIERLRSNKLVKAFGKAVIPAVVLSSTLTGCASAEAPKQPAATISASATPSGEASPSATPTIPKESSSTPEQSPSTTTQSPNKPTATSEAPAQLEHGAGALRPLTGAETSGLTPEQMYDLLALPAGAEKATPAQILLWQANIDRSIENYKVTPEDYAAWKEKNDDPNSRYTDQLVRDHKKLFAHSYGVSVDSMKDGSPLDVKAWEYALLADYALTINNETHGKSGVPKWSTKISRVVQNPTKTGWSYETSDSSGLSEAYILTIKKKYFKDSLKGVGYPVEGLDSTYKESWFVDNGKIKVTGGKLAVFTPEPITI